MDINKEIEIIKQRLEAEIEKAVKDWWNDFRQLKPERLPWFNSGLKGFLRKVYYNNSPENPDWQHYRMEHSKLTLSEYAKIQDDLDLFMIENNPSSLVPKDILDSLKNKIKIIINKELNSIASLFSNYMAQSGIKPNTNQPSKNDNLSLADDEKPAANNQPSKNNNLSLADDEKPAANNQPSKNNNLSLADDDEDDSSPMLQQLNKNMDDLNKKYDSKIKFDNDDLQIVGDEDDSSTIDYFGDNDEDKDEDDSNTIDSDNKDDSKVKFDDNDDDLTIPKLIPPSLGDDDDNDEEDDDGDGDDENDKDKKITTLNNDDSKENDKPIKKEDLKSITDSLGNLYYEKKYGENKEISGDVAKIFKSIGIPTTLKKTPSGTLHLIKPSPKSLESVANRLIALMNELKEFKESKPDGDENGSYDNKDYSFKEFGIPEDFISNLEDSSKSWDLLARNNDPDFVMGLKISRDLLNKINEINNKFGESALFRFKQLIRS